MDIVTVDREVYKQGKEYIETVPWIEELDLSHLEDLFIQINCRLHATCDFREIVGCLAILEHLANKYPARTFGIRDMCHVEEEVEVYGYGGLPRNVLFIIADKITLYNNVEKEIDWKELKVGYGVFMLESTHPDYIPFKKDKFIRPKNVTKIAKKEIQKASGVLNSNPFSALEVEECFED